MTMIVSGIIVCFINFILFLNISLFQFFLVICAQVLLYFVIYYFLEDYLDKSIFDFEGSSPIFRKIRYKLQQNIMDRERRVELGDKQSLEYQDIINSLDLKLGIIDDDFNLIFVNNKFKEIFQLDKADSLKTGLRDLAFSSEIKSLINNKEKKTFEWHRPIPNNQYYDIVAFPVNNFFCIVLKNITKIRQLETVRKDFVANVSHELKTPLSSIIGYAETLSMTNKEKTNNKFIQTILEQSTRMKNLIEDLLSLSTYENHEKTITPQHCNVSEAVSIAINSLESKSKEKKIEIVFNQQSKSWAVRCSKQELIQIAINIIDNSIKYSKENTQIVIQLNLLDDPLRKREYLNITFQDEGLGIAEEHIPRLTERFYRTDVARSREVGGTGLGLSIVKHILNNNNGLLEISSKVGVGSTFTVSLPLSKS
ncbi:MAG: ATP-binding protein [Proteobacteria bacterium]|nr:ATP-binding protein [Pseudomonadota bacterium]